MHQLRIPITALLTGIISLSTLFLIVSYVHAQEEAVLPETCTEERTERQATREERKESLTAELQKRVINLSHNIINRLSAVSERMNNITTRIETRMQKLREQGVDVTNTEAKIAETKVLLRTLEATVDNLNTVDAIVTGNTPRESFRQIREQFIFSRELVKQIHQNLLDAVTLLKETMRGTGTGNGVSDAVQNDTATSLAQE